MDLEDGVGGGMTRGGGEGEEGFGGKEGGKGGTGEDIAVITEREINFISTFSVFSLVVLSIQFQELLYVRV